MKLENKMKRKKFRNRLKHEHRYSVSHFKKEFAEIVFRWEINLKTYKKVKKRIYSRGRQTEAFDLEQAASILYMWDRNLSPSSTYANDAIFDLSKILPNKSGLTPQQLFQKYWLPSDKDKKEEFDRWASRCIKLGLCDSYDEYINHRTAELMHIFSNSPLAVKYGLLYFIFKYIENGSFEELKTDINSIPDKAIKTVEMLVDESKRREEENKKKLEKFND